VIVPRGTFDENISVLRFYLVIITISVQVLKTDSNWMKNITSKIVIKFL